VPGRSTSRIGDRAGIAWDKAREHRFERASGKRIEQPAS